MRLSLAGARAVMLATAAVFAASDVQAAVLTHRWSFNGDGTDSVGGSTAIAGTGATFGATSVDLVTGTVDLGSGAKINTYSAVTFDAWFSYSTIPNNVHLFVVDNGNGGGTGNYLRYNVYDSGNGNNGISFLESTWNAGGKLPAGASQLPASPVVVHLTAVYDPSASTKSIYVDGALVATSNVTNVAMNILTSNVSLGKSPWGSDPKLTGSIDEFRIFEGAMDSAEVAGYHALGPGVVPEPVSLSLLSLGGLGLLARRRA